MIPSPSEGVWTFGGEGNIYDFKRIGKIKGDFVKIDKIKWKFYAKKGLLMKAVFKYNRGIIRNWRDYNVDMMLFAALGSIIALIFAGVLFFKTKRQPAGNDLMVKISTAIKHGADAYLKRQYLGVGVFFAVVFFVLLILAILGYLNPFGAVCVSHRRIFFRPFRIYWYENSNHGKWKNGICGQQRT